MHVPLNDHHPATGPDTGLREPTESDDEFLSVAPRPVGFSKWEWQAPYPGHRTDTRRKVRRS